MKHAETVKRTSVLIRQSLWKAAKLRAVEEDRTLVDLLVEALEDYLRKPRKVQMALKGGKQ